MSLAHYEDDVDIASSPIPAMRAEPPVRGPVLVPDVDEIRQK